nr:MAG TPA: hypothetical protein [Caudoviricetes sp.]
MAAHVKNAGFSIYILHISEIFCFSCVHLFLEN